MRLYTKILLLLALILSIIFIGLIVMRINDLNTVQRLHDIRLAEEKISFEKILNLQSRSLELFAGDYSNWDEMVQFVKSRDLIWTKDNIEDIVHKFNTQAAWVYSDQLELIYTLNKTGDASLQKGPLVIDELRSLIHNNPFSHFFVITVKGIVEINTAPIQPSYDNERLTPAKGYFAVGRLWTNAYLDEISTLSNKRLRIVTKQEAGELKEKNIQPTFIEIRVPLPGWGTQPIGEIIATQEIVTLTEMLRSMNSEYRFMIVYVMILMLVLSLFLLLWVTKPLNRISASLNSGDISMLHTVKGVALEFKEISDLIELFFQQRERLVQEIESHKRTEQDYRSLFEYAHDVILVISPLTGMIMDVNQKACSIYGYDRKDIIEQPVHLIWKKTGQFEKLRDQIISRGFCTGVEAVHVSRSGKEMVFEINATGIDYAGQKVILLIQRDISEKKIMQELNLSHSILKKVGNLIIVANSSGRIIYINQAVKSLLGYEPSELLGMGWWNLTRDDPKEREREIGSIIRYAKGEMPPSESGYKRSIRRKDGSRCWILWHDFKGAEDLLIGVGYDVTEQKKAEAALIESERHYRLLFENNPVPVWVFDIETLRFLEVNDAAVAQYGYTREEFLSMTIKDIRPAEDIPLLLENMEEEKDIDQKKKIWRHRKKDGTLTEVEVTTHRHLFHGRKARLVLIDDLTERRRRELTELKLRMQKMRLATVIQTQEEERKRVARELHDGLGQVLSAIKRKLEYIAVKSTGTKSKKLKEEHENAVAIADSALKEVRRMAYNLVPSVLEDFGLFEAIDRLCHQSFQNTGVEIHFQTFAFDRRLSPAAELGVYRIIQEAFQNILKHAQATEATLQIVDQTTKLIITIEDNGKGFDMQSVKRRPADKKGMGILSMRERVEFLNGSFHIYSTLGKGTSVIVELPLEEEK